MTTLTELVQQAKLRSDQLSDLSPEEKGRELSDNEVLNLESPIIAALIHEKISLQVALAIPQTVREAIENPFTLQWYLANKLPWTEELHDEDKELISLSSIEEVAKVLKDHHSQQTVEDLNLGQCLNLINPYIQSLIGQGSNKLSIDEAKDLTTVEYFSLSNPQIHALIGNKLSLPEAKSLTMTQSLNFQRKKISDRLGQELSLQEAKDLTPTQCANLESNIIRGYIGKELSFKEAKDLSSQQRGNLESAKIREWIGKELSFEEAKNLSRLQRQNLESPEIRSLIASAELSLKMAKNLTSVQRDNLKSKTVIKYLGLGAAQLSLQQVLELTPSQRSNLEVVDALHLIGKDSKHLALDLVLNFTEKDLAFIQSQDTQQHLASTETREARIELIKILATAHAIVECQANIKMMEKYTLTGSESSIDANETLKANAHFENVIKPFLKLKFESNGGNDKERIVNIEKQIRQVLLEEIEKNLSGESLAFVRQYKNELINLEENILKKSRAYLTSNEDSAQMAWRCYDAGAPIAGEWPNLFVEPNDPHKAIFTTREASQGAEKLDQSKASDLVRERAAYYFLVMMDQPDSQVLRQSFLNYLAEIRRAHNSKNSQVDDPSCFPGHFIRFAQIGVSHPVAKLPDSLKAILQRELNQQILIKFSEMMREQPDATARSELYHALVMLSDVNAADLSENLADNPEDYPYALLLLRQQFIERLGSEAEILAKLNTVLKREIGRELLGDEILYFKLALANPGGGNAISGLSSCYLAMSERTPSSEFILSESKFDNKTPQELGWQKTLLSLKPISEAKKEINLERNPYPLRSEQDILKTLPQGLKDREARAGRMAKSEAYKHAVYELLLPLVNKALEGSSISEGQVQKFLKDFVDEYAYQVTQQDMNPLFATFEELSGTSNLAVVNLLRQDKSSESELMVSLQKIQKYQQLSEGREGLDSSSQRPQLKN